MDQDYNKIIKTIKSLEKKHSRLSVLYSIIKLPIIKHKMNDYNKTITKYYNYILKNPELLKSIMDNTI